MSGAPFGATKGFEERAARVRAQSGKGSARTAHTRVARQGARRAGGVVLAALIVVGAGAMAAVGAV